MSNKKTKVELTEADIPSKTYDEFDSDEDQSIPLRTIVEFELFDRLTGELVPFDELGDQSRHISLRGMVIEPLPRDWRDTVIGLCCTSPSDTLELNIASPVKVKRESSDPDTEADNTAVPPNAFDSRKTLDWDALKAGDTVDGYCNQTFKWYQAKIVLHDPVKDRYKVHFQGWNNKYDEWIEKYSERLVPHGTSHLIMREAVQQAARMVPWYQHSTLMKRAQEVLGKKFPSRQPLSVTIDRIDDWCVDYTYANPTLWLIAGDVWYRVAGALCRGGCFGSPSDSYRPVFQQALEKYLCAAHISMILLDQLPTNPTVTFQAVVEEAARRSVGLVNEINALQHYQFLCDQLTNIDVPPEWDPKITIVKSTFMNQLKREGELFLEGGGLQALSEGTYKGAHMKRRTALFRHYSVALVELSHGIVSETQAALMQLDFVSNGEVEKVGKRGRRPSTGIKKKPVKIEYPYDDSIIWETEHQNAKIKTTPIPVPKISEQLLRILEDDQQSFHYQNLFLVIMSTLTNFRNTLKLPAFQLQDLEQAILSDSTISPLLRQTCVSLLMVIIRAYVQDGVIKTSFPDERKINIDEEDNDRDCRQPLVLEAAKSEESLFKFLQTGETWVEIAKIICEKVNYSDFEIVLEGPIDPLAVCQDIFKEMANRFNVIPFAAPIDADVHGLPEYSEVIDEPMDFGTIKTRLATGWYEAVEDYTLTPDDGDSLQKTPEDCFDARVVHLKRPFDSAFSVGQIVDFYDRQLKRWIEGLVVAREYADESKSRTVTAYIIRRVGFGSDVATCRVSVEDERVIAHKSASPDRARRLLSPEELFQKYPQYAPIDTALGEIDALTTANRSHHCGVKGFAEDMRLVWTNCYQYYSHFGDFEHNEFVQEAQKMEAYFEAALQQRVLRFTDIDYSQLVTQYVSDSLPQQFYRPTECWKLALKALSSCDSRDVVSEFVPEMNLPEDMEMLHLLADLKRKPFLNLRVQDKIVFLHWLCHAFLDTDFVHAELNAGGQAPKAPVPLRQLMIQRNSGADANSDDEDENGDDMSGDEGTEGKLEVVTKTTKSGRKSISKASSLTSMASLDEKASKGSANGSVKKRKRQSTGSVVSESDNEDDGRATATSASKAPAKKRTKLNSASADPSTDGNKSTATTPHKRAPSDDGLMLHRHDCLGIDRFGNRYWVFSRHFTQDATLFCELRHVVGIATPDYTIAQPRSPRWLLFTHPSDILTLLLWLDERGTSEAFLLRGIYEWIKDNGIQLPPVETPVAATSVTAEDVEGEMTEDNAAATVTPAKAMEKKKFFRRTEDKLTYEFISLWRKNGFFIEDLVVSPSKPLSEDALTQRLNQYLQLPREHVWYFVFYVTFSAISKQLGMGVKAGGDGAVYVTSFAPQSVTKAAGFRVGDRILVAGNKLRPTVPNLVELVKKAGQDIDSSADRHKKVRLAFLVRRSTAANFDQVFNAMMERDKDIAVHYKKDIDDEALALQKAMQAHESFSLKKQPTNSTSVDVYHHRMWELPGQYNHLFTTIINLVLKLAHPACCSHYWRNGLLETWLVKLVEIMSDPEVVSLDIAGSVLSQYLSRFLLDLELDLFRMGSVLRDDWLGGSDFDVNLLNIAVGSYSTGITYYGGSNGNSSSSNASTPFVEPLSALLGCASRSRSQWRRFCHNAQSPEQISFALAVLNQQAIDWDVFQSLIVPVEEGQVKTVLTQLGVDIEHFAHILKEQSRLIYFGDGHEVAVRADCDMSANEHFELAHQLSDAFMRKPRGKNSSTSSPALAYRRHGVLWGDSHAPQTGCAYICQVAKCQVYSGIVPFVQVTLTILSPAAQNSHGFPAPARVLTPPNQRSWLNRHLLRVLQLMKKYNTHKPFLEPVNAEEYPTYYEVIKRPIDLTMIEKKMNAWQYTSQQQFLDDMALLHRNCCTFNGADSKKFPPLALALSQDAQLLCRILIEGELETLDVEDNRLDDGLTPSVDIEPMEVDGEENNDEGAVKDLAPKEEEVVVRKRGRPSRSSNGNASSATATSTAASASSNTGATGGDAATAAIKTMTVTMRLDRLWPMFLVDQDAYFRGLKLWNASSVTADKSTVKMEVGVDRQGNARFATGVVVGNKEPIALGSRHSSAAKIMPWEYVKVDWLEPTDAILPEYVNCWDVQIGR